MTVLVAAMEGPCSLTGVNNMDTQSSESYTNDCNTVLNVNVSRSRGFTVAASFCRKIDYDRSMLHGRDHFIGD